MISETRFAKSYSSLWRGIAPTMELFIRKCNLRLYQRDWPAVLSRSVPERRAPINQVAYELFCGAFDATSRTSVMLDFVRNEQHVLSAQAAVGLSREVELTNDEKAEAADIASRMWHKFSIPTRETLTLRPVFKGCGIISTCAGDVLRHPSHLVEFKDGDRPFRSYEFRQLSIYAALLLNETGYPPDSLEVVNSRRGTSVCVTMDSFADEVAGQSSYDYLRELVRILSDVGLSL